MKGQKKALHCYAVCAIVEMFTILMLIMSCISNWNQWVNLYLIMTAVTLSFVTFSNKVSEKLQSYIIIIAGMLNICIYSCMSQEFYPVLTVISTFAIVTFVYKDTMLFIIMTIMSFIITGIHLFIWDTVRLESPQEMMMFVIRVSILFVSLIFLAVFVYRLTVIENNLKNIAEEAQKAEHSKTDFLANISHEIRTPMNAIIGMCELILREDIKENVREYCYSIQDSGRNLLAIINDLLEFVIPLKISDSEKGYLKDLDDKKNSVMCFTAPAAKILIVDDNITNLKVAEGLMKPYNMQITTATNGLEAIQLLKNRNYNLVFMDHMMPEMDGVEATNIIRSMEGDYYKKLPIIALTANAVNGAREMFLKEGFSDFIAKPIEITILDRVLKAWLPKEFIQSSDYHIAQEERKADAVNDLADTVDVNINLKKGLAYAGNDKDLYLEILDVYNRNGQNNINSLDKRFADKDWKNYVIEVHALKSSSLSIGAEVLSGLAKELEFAGKEGRYEIIEEKHTGLLKLYKELLEEVTKYLLEYKPVQETQQVREITEEEFAEYMEHIREGYDVFDAEQMTVAAEELCACSYRGKSLKTYFINVKNLANDFEYEQAWEEARKAEKECSE